MPPWAISHGNDWGGLMRDGLAPVVLFAYARPEHTSKTLQALAANRLAENTDLIIYADAARGEKDAGRVLAVRDIVRRVSGFRSVTLIEREFNYGLARNIIDGVTEVSDSHGRVIVLEDDIVTSQDFLAFMNAALSRYEYDSRVWHVSGWNYPIDPSGLGDAFFWRVMNCWGWATWADRWQHFQKNPARLMETWGRGQIDRFNLDGAHDFWGQVRANSRGKLNTWAIFWYATIFEHNGLCLNPARTLVRNIGNDGSGENCGRTDDFSCSRLGSEFDGLPDVVEESALAVERTRNFYRSMRRPFIQMVFKRVRNLASAVWGS